MQERDKKTEKDNKYENYISKYNRENKKTEISKYNIKIEDFEGPLDLLWFLVKKNKMNIDDADKALRLKKDGFWYVTTK